MQSYLIKLLFGFTLIIITAFNSIADNYLFVTLEFAPLEFSDEKGNAQGIAVEIVKKIMKDLGHKLEIKVLPWPRALAMVKSGNADAIFTAYKNPEREQFLDYSREILIPQIVYFYALKGHKHKFTGNMEDVKNLKIGVTSTISYGRNFDNYKDNLNIEQASTFDGNLKKLLTKRIDLLPSNIYVGDYTIKKQRLTNKIVKLPVAIEEIPSYIAFSKVNNLRNLRDQFDNKIRAIKKNKTFDKILKKYGVKIQ